MYGRRRLGDRAQLHRLRPARQRRDRRSCTKAAPNHPREDRFWEIIEKYRVTIFYTAPTAIRAFIKWGDQWPKGHDLSSLRLLGTVGEPINPEAWMWYHEVIGGGRCPIVDTWWQTETGVIMIAPLPGAIPTKPGSATRPLPGIVAEVVDKQGKPVPANQGGFLVIKQPWPACCGRSTATTSAIKQQYWSQMPGCYFTADGARRDEDGYFWIMGRVDDVLNVSGHRLSTMEVESALVHHPKVAEAAVVGKPDETQGRRHRLLRDAQGRASRRADELKKELQRARRQGDRRAGPAGRDSLHRRAAEDALGQDHAAAACATSPAAERRRGTRRRWKTSACWRSCGRKKRDRPQACDSPFDSSGWGGDPLARRNVNFQMNRQNDRNAMPAKGNGSSTQSRRNGESILSSGRIVSTHHRYSD